MADRRYTIAVDFDGVIHRYDSPWQGHDVIPDEPVVGAIDWLRQIEKRFDVLVFTTRGKTEAGRAAVTKWLCDHGLPEAREMGRFRVTAEKPAALVYIDDRAWRFDGANFPTAHEIHQARPWHKREDG